VGGGDVVLLRQDLAVQPRLAWKFAILLSQPMECGFTDASRYTFLVSNFPTLLFKERKA
jgi:hypothetical protein